MAVTVLVVSDCGGQRLWWSATVVVSASQDHHAAQDVTVVHAGERLLDPVQRDRLADEAVEGEAALLVEGDEGREVPAGQAVTVPARLQRPAPAEHVQQRQLQGHLGPGY